MRKLRAPLVLPAFLLLWIQAVAPTRCSCIPPSGCSVALANYIVSAGETPFSVATKFQTSLTSVLQYNQLPDINTVVAKQALLVPFQCSCMDGNLGHTFPYTIVAGDTVDNVISMKFANLSQTDQVLSASDITDATTLSPGSYLNIPIKCSCGDPDVSKAYGMFLTYVIQAGDTLASLSQKFGIQSELLNKYNGNVNLNNPVAYKDVIFVPTKDANGVYLPYNASDTGGGSNKPAIIGGSVAGVFVVLLVAAFMTIMVRRRKRNQYHRPHKDDTGLMTGVQLQPHATYPSLSNSDERITEFSYQQLAEITNNFSLTNTIGSGGFAVVYYAEMNKKKLAIKKMGIDASKEFVAELKVLARVHHRNLVELVGWCKVNGLFLVYEFVENGTLKQHLDAPKRGGTPLTWLSRLQIALDSARGVEYIHEYTVPSYMHRDIKPDNILLDNNLRAKVADFGLAKLGEITGTVHNAGTAGYMAPESILYGEISPKVDVFAFGVVLMQLISAKPSVVAMDTDDKMLLTNLFADFVKDSEAKENLSSFVDPTLQESVRTDEHTSASIWKVILLACECTDLQPDNRPHMTRIVTRLSSLLSPTQEDNSFGILNFQSGNRE